VTIDVSAGGLAFDALTSTLYATGLACSAISCQSSLFTIDAVTAVATLIGSTSGFSLQFGGLEFAPCVTGGTSH
jgi:hypothetical protein